jgi:uncharacterized phage-associated protein
MNTAKQVAEFFLEQNSYEEDERLTNLKIQKLVYYAQGHYLGLYNKSLFNEPIIAWLHGPVVESLYFEYKQNGAEGIPIPKNYDASVFDHNQIELLKEIYMVYGQYSAWKLRNMTHNERPWLETRKNREISVKLLRTYFKDLIA